MSSDSAVLKVTFLKTWIALQQVSLVRILLYKKPIYKKEMQLLKILKNFCHFNLFL